MIDTSTDNMPELELELVCVKEYVPKISNKLTLKDMCTTSEELPRRVKDIVSKQVWEAIGDGGELNIDTDADSDEEGVNASTSGVDAKYAGQFDERLNSSLMVSAMWFNGKLVWFQASCNRDRTFEFVFSRETGALILGARDRSCIYYIYSTYGQLDSYGQLGSNRSRMINLDTIVEKPAVEYVSKWLSKMVPGRVRVLRNAKDLEGIPLKRLYEWFEDDEETRRTRMRRRLRTRRTRMRWARRMTMRRRRMMSEK
jgi:hypothetical protein